jgi:uridine phosphorylase
MITETFDNTSEEILKPSHIVKKRDNRGFPETVIVSFSQKMIDVFINSDETEIVSTISAGVKIPIYKTWYKGKAFAFYLSWIGAPVTVAILEEVIAMGAKKVLLFGSSGSLDKNITDGHIIIPTHAYRDEGTSYHYASAKEGSFIEVKTAGKLSKIFSEIGIPALEGKTWTTDAIYRETQKNKEARKQAGCITVEMECASVMAMAQFRGVEVFQFLYTADNLDCTEWEPRLLGAMPQDVREKYVRIALEVALRL